MDTAEVDAPLRARLWQTIFFFGMLILITGAGLLLIWRQQRIHLYRGQVEAAMALYASEEKFRLAFDTSPDSVAITRVSDGMFVSVNKGFEQITGYTREQVLGKTSAEINIWKDLADRRNVIEELQATGKVQNYEASFVTLDGEIYGLMSAVIIELNGEPHILNITRDITERKRAEEALRESERRFRDIMENVNLISAMLDINGNIIFANNYFLKLTGWQLEEVLGRNWFELLIPPEAEARHVLLEGMKEGPVPPHYQNEIFTRNGELRLIDWSNTLLRDAQGNRAGIAGIGVDITERKRAEKALYESEERFRRLAENAQDLIYRYELSPKRGFSYVSPAATTITGYSPEEHYADPDLGFKLVHPDDRQLLAMATQDGGAIRKPLMLRWIRKDGSMLWTEQRNVPIYAEDGTLVAIEGIAIDITERKRAEAILHESETNLSALIENTDGSIWAVDQQYRLIVGNGEFHHNTSAALGRRLEMGESVLLPSFPAEVNAEWQGLYDRALQGERFTLETVTHFREEPRYIEYRLSPIREDGGEIRGVTVYGRDITERRKAEKEIRFKDDLLHMTSEMAKIGGWEFDALTLEGTWTDEVAHIHGLDPAQPTNVQLGASFYLPDSRRKIEQSIQEAIEFARPYDLELQMVTTNGEQKWVRTMGLPILADGKVVKLQGIFQDITERKLAEEVLHQLNDRLALAQRLAGAGIWDWDLTTGKLNWTPEFFSLFGLDPAKSDATFDTWRGALHPDDIQGAEQRINEAIRDHTPLFNEYRVVTPSDEIRWIGAWGDTTYNERGEAQRLLFLNYKRTFWLSCRVSF
jgi:PAS domain S-box-containing protein